MMEPYGFVYFPRMKNMMTIVVVPKPIVFCRECKHYFKDDNGHVIVMRCELNHECMRDNFFCADGEKEGTDEDH